MFKRVMLFLMVLLAYSLNAFGQQDVAAILNSLNFQKGNIKLGNSMAQLSLGEGYRYLSNADTQKFLTQVWHNPPGSGSSSLGMIIPLEPNPFDKDGWAAIVSYDPSGYVSDKDAESINYDVLLKDMKQSTSEASKERVAQGYTSMELVGWARKPFYDQKNKKLLWAKRLKFGNEETLNYCIRILGRGGVLDINVVASMDALPFIDKNIEDVLARVEFLPGNTYAEYNPSIDSAASYGLAGLIAGGALVKSGFLKGLLAVLLASKKAIGIGVIAIFAGLIKLFKSKSSRKNGETK